MRGVISGKRLVFGTATFSTGVTANKSIRKVMLENSACVCLILTY